MRATLRDLRRNLLINYQALSPAQRRAYHWLVRPFWPASERAFLEGVPNIPGQLYRAERRALHEALVRLAPKFAFEIGTFNGGGSTFFLARAFAQLGHGKLLTIEIDPGLHARAIALYAKQLPTLRPHVEFLLGGTPDLFVPWLQQAGSAEFVFLDGAEDAAQSLAQFRFFEPWFRPGSVLAMHDWHTEKMRALKSIIAGSPHWRQLVELGEPKSIGFAIYQLQ
jgi:predicted O-methyltransferase YrrM